MFVLLLCKWFLRSEERGGGTPAALPGHTRGNRSVSNRLPSQPAPAQINTFSTGTPRWQRSHEAASV